MYYNLLKALVKWIISFKIWRIILNEVILTNTSLPVFAGGDLYAASEPFFHADRTVDFNILIYVLEGTIYVTEEDTDYAVGEGELLVLKSGVHHFGKYEIAKGTRWYYIHFYTDNSTVSGCKEYVVCDNNDYNRYFMRLPKYLSGLSGSNTEWLISDFISYTHSNDKTKEWNINLKLSELLSAIAFDRSKSSFTLPVRICRYLDANYKQKFSVQTLEKEFYLSYKYMAACFKKEIGRSMQQYHTAVRMDEAARLLRSTLMPIGEIAAEVGYEDMLYFSKYFHRFFGMSPTAYRKTAREY